jgi:hypothetical protein
MIGPASGAPPYARRRIPAQNRARAVAPGLQGTNRTDLGFRRVEDGFFLVLAELVGFAAGQRNNHPIFREAQIFQVEGGEFGTAKGSRKTQQQNRLVALYAYLNRGPVVSREKA